MAGPGELKERTSVTRTLRIKSEHQHFGRRKENKKLQEGVGEMTLILHLFFPFFLSRSRSPLFFFPPNSKEGSIFAHKDPWISKPRNHLGKPAHPLLGARNYAGWKTTSSNSCKSDEPPPTDGAMIPTA